MDLTEDRGDMIIPTRLTVADWFELHPFMEPGPIAMTKHEWSALREANNGEPRGPHPTMLGHPIEVVPDWPTWLDPDQPHRPRHYQPMTEHDFEDA